MNRRLSLKTLLAPMALALSLAFAPPSSQADPASMPAAAASANPDTSAMEAALKAHIPGLVIDSVRPSEIPGLYAVISGHSVIYADLSGTHVINGHIFEVASRTDDTAMMLADLTRIDPKQLPLADSFSETLGNGSRQLYVFSDPDCPYCKQLEHELPKLTDVTVHVFLFPLSAIHPNAKTNAVGVWCAADRARAWHDKMMNDVLPPPGSCDTPIERNLALAEKLGISGTPTLIFADGKTMAGTLSAEEINALLGPTH